MGKKKVTGEYNDFIDGEKLRDNAGIRQIWNASSPKAQHNPSSSQSNTRSELQSREAISKSQGNQKKPALTHFLCFPLVTSTNRAELQQGLMKLKEELERDNVVSTQALRPVGTLHLTLGVMSLDHDRVEEAKQYLQELDLQSLLRDVTMQNMAEQAAQEGTIAENLNAAAMPDTSALVVALKDLSPMQAADNTGVLYARPHDSTERLLPFSVAIKRGFMEKGLVVDENRALILHATIINTVYAKPKGGGRSQSSKNWMRFDARTLIENYKDFTWTENLKIDRVQILKMGAKKIWSGGSEGGGEVIDEEYEVVYEKIISQ